MVKRKEVKMGRSRFVSPEAVRVELSEGDWVEFKRALTYGESQEQAVLAQDINANPEHRDKAGRRFVERRLVAWIVDWSFKDDTGRPVEVSAEAIGNIDTDTGMELDTAINDHIARMTEEKKAKTPTLSLIATSS